MGFVYSNDERNIKEKLFAFLICYLMAIPTFIKIVLIPFKSNTIINDISHERFT